MEFASCLTGSCIIGIPGAAIATEPDMKNVRPGIDAAFVEKQRQYLLRLRADLIAAAEASETDEANVKGQRAGAAERDVAMDHEGRLPG